MIGKLTKNFYHEFKAGRAGKLVEAFDRVVVSVPALEEALHQYALLLGVSGEYLGSASDRAWTNPATTLVR